ncbi:hypothetical protein ABPG72_002522 [Tetrahymena utriculariae]
MANDAGVGGGEGSILEEINDLIENQKNKSFEIDTVKQISEYSDENSDNKLQFDKSIKQKKHTINTLSSKESSHHQGSNKNINNQNNFSNQLNVKDENIDITSEQSIQNIKELQLKKIENLKFENNIESPIDIYFSKFNIGGAFKTSSVNVKKLSQSDKSVLPEIEGNIHSTQQHDTFESKSKKLEKSIASPSQNQNKSVDNYMKQVNQLFIQQQICEEEETIQRQMNGLSNILEDLKTQKAQLIDQKLDDQPFIISPLNEELKKQPSIELEIFSPELRDKDSQRRLTKGKSNMSKQIVMLDNNQIMHQSNNQSSQMEERQSLMKNTGNKGSGVKLKDKKIGFSQLDVQNEQIIQLEKKNFINQNGTVSNYSDNEINIKDEKEQSSKNFSYYRKQVYITGSLIKKSDRQILVKSKTTTSLEKNSFFPINEDAFVKNTSNLNIDLLIYRKQLLWNSSIQKQKKDIFEFDEEILKMF